MATLYKYRPTVMALDNPGKRYVLTVHDLPEDEKPREKLQRHGPQSLSTPELIAVVLGTGTTKENLLAMSSRIAREYGERSIMTAENPEKLSEDLDIPAGKASQIVACAELGRRFYKRNDAELPIIRTARDVHAFVKDMYDLPKEHLRGIYLNAHYKVMHVETISIGTVDTSIIHPREVFKPALEYGAAAVVLVHNHPSGVVSASDADTAITNQLIEAGKILGIELIDHVIVTRESFACVPADFSK